MGRVVPLVLLLAILGGVLVSRGRGQRVVQPIQFNHAKHTALELECSLCHEHVAEQAFAGLPQATVCMLCHSAPMSESLEEEKVRQFAARGEAIPWRRVYRLPAHVFFSHRRHVTLGKIECSTCHGSIAEATVPPSRPAVKLAMEWCLECHGQRGALVDCNACHR